MIKFVSVEIKPNPVNVNSQFLLSVEVAITADVLLDENDAVLLDENGYSLTDSKE